MSSTRLSAVLSEGGGGGYVTVNPNSLVLSSVVTHPASHTYLHALHYKDMFLKSE